MAIRYRVEDGRGRCDRSAQTAPASRCICERARQAALALLAERGYANFSLADVAVAAGIHRASLYRRWPTKSALVADAIATAIPVSPGDALSAHGGRLEELARALARFIGSPVGRAVVRLLLALPDDLELEAATRNAWTELMGGTPGEAGVDPELPSRSSRWRVQSFTAYLSSDSPSLIATSPPL